MATTTDYTTKTQVRRDFAHARYLMSIANKMMTDKSVTDFSEPSEFGQLANELIACVNTLQNWLDDMQLKQNEKENN